MTWDAKTTLNSSVTLSVNYTERTVKWLKDLGERGVLPYGREHE